MCEWAKPLLGPKKKKKKEQKTVMEKKLLTFSSNALRLQTAHCKSTHTYTQARLTNTWTRVYIISYHIHACRSWRNSEEGTTQQGFSLGSHYHGRRRTEHLSVKRLLQNDGLLLPRSCVQQRYHQMDGAVKYYTKFCWPRKILGFVLNI